MSKTVTSRQILSILPIFLFFGCHGSPPFQKVPEKPVRLRLAAATDLQPWLGEAIEKWGSEQMPALTIQTIYGSSGQLAAQIRAGAPIDLFLAADIKIVEQLAFEKIAIPESVKLYGIGRLVLIFRKSLAPKAWTDLDLTDLKKLSIANPETAPYGRAARDSLQYAGLWSKVRDRIVIAESVRQALQQVLSGNSEFGIVALGQAKEAIQKNTEFGYLEIPEPSHPPIRQGLAVIAHADQTESALNSANQLADWITSNQTTKLFQNHGIHRP
ncbi:MAG: molybdate ABC transporter substrate-binding protein [Planctomycetota bacterium]|nr:molybdate ABC transporter substrate-binding protein [Planctomycetota bacterium]